MREGPDIETHVRKLKIDRKSAAAVALGRKGGSVRSIAKKKASKRNLRKANKALAESRRKVPYGLKEMEEKTK